MFRNLCLIFCLSVVASCASFNSTRPYESAGDQAFDRKDYHAAMQHYRKVLERSPDGTAVWWKYAEAARLIQAYAEAEKAYGKVAGTANRRRNYPLAHFRLGELKKVQGQYREAIGHFEKYLAQAGGVPADWAARARSELQNSRWALDAAGEGQPAVVTHLGKEVNSPYSDFAPFAIGDTLLFSSYRFENKKDRNEPKGRLTRLMMSARGGRARELGRGGWPVTDTAHVAHTATTPDGNFMFFTVCQNLNAHDIRCALWLTVRDRRGRWNPPQRLPAPVNLPGFTATQPSVGYDEEADGPVLWFASDRPGGQGGLDLWSVPLDTVYFCPCALPLPGKKVEPARHFAAPQNAAALNTPQNDVTPFFFAPTQTLYFSSDGRPGLGGYDIYSAKKSGASWGEVKNAGKGLNTSFNDLYFFLRPDGRNGYLSSNRPGSYYLDEANKACCNDIFAFQLPGPPPPKDTIPLIDPKIPAPDTTRRPAPEPVPPPQVRDFVGLPLYFDNDEPDKRSRATVTRRNYEETVLAYLRRQDEYRARFGSPLADAARSQAEEYVDAFFEEEVRRGYERLQELSELLLDRLTAGERITVVIKGFTSPRAKSDYNLNLGRRRISSVRNFFTAWNDGALQPFLASGTFKVQEASFGETTAPATLSDDLDDERNSVYHPDAARERRVEIVEIREN